LTTVGDGWKNDNNEANNGDEAERQQEKVSASEVPPGMAQHKIEMLRSFAVVASVAAFHLSQTSILWPPLRQLEAYSSSWRLLSPAGNDASMPLASAG
jgi:hypothetical protein